MLGELNGRLDDMTIEGMIGEHWFPDVNENGEKLEELCAERGKVIRIIWFKKRCIHKYIG